MKKYCVVFEKFEKFLWKCTQKDGFLFWQNCLKNRTFWFFSPNIPEHKKIPLLTGPKTVRKRYQVVFKIWAKKEVERPSVPSHPSIPSVNTRWLGRLIPRGWRSDGLGTARAILGKVSARLGTARARLGTVSARLGTVRTKLGKVRARHMVFLDLGKKFRNFIVRFDFFHLECSKGWFLYSTEGTKKNQDKMLGSFQDISEKDVFSTGQIFWFEKFPIYFILKFRKGVFTPLRRRLERIRKYWAVFKIFLKRSFFTAIFFRTKKMRNSFNGKNYDSFFLFYKISLHNASEGTKILSNFLKEIFSQPLFWKKVVNFFIGKISVYLFSSKTLSS